MYTNRLVSELVADIKILVESSAKLKDVSPHWMKIWKMWVKTQKNLEQDWTKEDGDLDNKRQPNQQKKPGQPGGAGQTKPKPTTNGAQPRAAPPQTNGKIKPRIGLAGAPPGANSTGPGAGAPGQPRIGLAGASPGVNKTPQITGKAQPRVGQAGAPPEANKAPLGAAGGAQQSSAQPGAPPQPDPTDVVTDDSEGRASGLSE